jgi:hypothetical protein
VAGGYVGQPRHIINRFLLDFRAICGKHTLEDLEICVNSTRRTVFWVAYGVGYKDDLLNFGNVALSDAVHILRPMFRSRANDDQTKRVISSKESPNLTCPLILQRRWNDNEVRVVRNSFWSATKRHICDETKQSDTAQNFGRIATRTHQF